MTASVDICLHRDRNSTDKMLNSFKGVTSVRGTC